jgi:RNA polymerase sigma-70 factor (ECF subfamily)
VNDERPLIHRAQRGDRDAFGQLVRRYQDRLFNSLLRMLDQPQEAEDVAQEAFVQAYLKLDTFEGRSSFYTWLYRIAVHVARNRQRQRRPAALIDEVELAAGAEQIDPSEWPGERLLREERAGQIQAALRRLGEQHRTVLVLRDVEDFDYQTIARLLNISVGTVRSRLHRARSALRDQLQRWQSPQE